MKQCFHYFETLNKSLCGLGDLRGKMSLSLKISSRLFDFQFNLFSKKGRYEFIYDEGDG
jgi:hypothetical protein